MLIEGVFQTTVHTTPSRCTRNPVLSIRVAAPAPWSTERRHTWLERAHPTISSCLTTNSAPKARNSSKRSSFGHMSEDSSPCKTFLAQVQPTSSGGTPGALAPINKTFCSRRGTARDQTVCALRTLIRGDTIIKICSVIKGWLIHYP
jgi:hypothetical protein